MLARRSRRRTAGYITRCRPARHKICASPITRNAGPRHLHGWILAYRLFKPLFLALYRGPDPPFDPGSRSAQQRARHHEIPIAT